MGDTAARLPHAALDLRGRWPKAEKIRLLLGLPAGRRLRVLEIGTGSGAIANYFGVHDELDCEVDAVDVLDQRRTREGFRFHRVVGVRLPFDEAVFDVVISNHVIEHVGGHDAQQVHVAEIARVLRPGGQAYLAFPNRWQVVEPHYGLAFLSWLPRRWRTPYLCRTGRGEVYDCEPLSLGEIEQLLAGSGLVFCNACVEAIRAMVVVEGCPSWLLRFAARLPAPFLAPFKAVCPTHVYLLKAPDGP